MTSQKISSSSLSQNLSQHSLPAGRYGYSATKLNDLEATEYTLVNLVVDVSSSVSDFKTEMEQCIKQVVEACKYSVRSDNLMIRISTFNSDLGELQGFKLLSKCQLDDYDDCLNVGGMTALFAAIENAIGSINSYAKTLTDNDFDTNAIVIVITDGEDNNSGRVTADTCKKALAKILKAEDLESIQTILVGINTDGSTDISPYLEDVRQEVGINQYVEIENANAKTLAKLADFVSRSISSQSQALGSGGVSQPLVF